MKNYNKKKLIPILLTSLLVPSFFYYQNNHLDIVQETLQFPQLPSAFHNFKILQLSDLHNKTFPHNKLEKTIRQLDFDIIVMTGDMVSANDTDFTPFIDLVRGLHKNYPIYYILGNHEISIQNKHPERMATLISSLSHMGVHVLIDQIDTLAREGSFINIIGLNQSLRYYRDSERYQSANILEVMPALSSTEFNLLLSHNPLHFEAYADWGADLTLSGHVHGGIIRLPFIGGLLSPDRTLFPKYSSGVYQLNKKYLYVNRGLGGSVVDLRIFSLPEITLITLQKGD